MAAAFFLTLTACGGLGLRRQYEYEEQLYLYADGSAALVVNSSIPALIALRGLALDPDPRARVDRNRVRELVAESGLEIARVSRPWRRHRRQFIQIRAKIADVQKLGQTKLFRWSSYSVVTSYSEVTSEYRREYRQRVGAPAGAAPANAGWDGSELVAFKLHAPSRVHTHNVRLLETNETGSTERGNILTWEQRLSDRLQGKPIDMQVSMDSGSILYRTLWVFGLSFAAAIVLLVVIIRLIIRRGRQRRQAAETRS